MLSDILTWGGAVLGIAVLLVMAFGSVALDFTDLKGERRAKVSGSEHSAEGVSTSSRCPAPPS